MAEVWVLGRYFVELRHDGKELIVDLEDLLYVHRVQSVLENYSLFLQLSVDGSQDALVFPDGTRVPWAEVVAAAKPARPDASSMAAGDPELDLGLAAGCHR
jgi:hypothetical protein